MFEKIISFSNLYASAHAAAKGKHDRAAVLRHDLHLEKILWRLQWQLQNGSYRHGGYHKFVVTDPKPRDVSAAPFTDRIVHHAIVRVIEPLFDKSFIFDSYACRTDKGTQKAALRLQHFLRSALSKYPTLYVLRADITKFFASIDQAILEQLIARKIHDSQTLELIHTIITSYKETLSTAQKNQGGGQLTRAVCYKHFSTNRPANWQPDFAAVC